MNSLTVQLKEAFMKKNILHISVPVLMLLGMVTACKKSNNDNNKPAITRETLAGTYKFASFKVSIAGSPEQDYPISACQQDDYYELKLDSVANYVDAGVKCSPPGDDTGKWTLTGNTITISAGTAITGNIQSFDGHVLVVTGQQSMSGISYTFKATLNKQ